MPQELKSFEEANWFTYHYVVKQRCSKSVLFCDNEMLGFIKIFCLVVQIMVGHKCFKITYKESF